MQLSGCSRASAVVLHKGRNAVSGWNIKTFFFYFALHFYYLFIYKQRDTLSGSRAGKGRWLGDAAYSRNVIIPSVPADWLHSSGKTIE